jgi:hypothetical protein
MARAHGRGQGEGAAATGNANPNPAQPRPRAKGLRALFTSRLPTEGVVDSTEPNLTTKVAS